MLCYDFSHFLHPKKDFVMPRNITYYTQSTVCQGGFSNKFLSSSSWAYAGFAKGGNYYLGEGACMRGIATRLLGGFGACFPEKNVLMVQFGAFWCVLVRFGAYFHKKFLSKSLKISFLYKNNYKL